MDSMTIYKCHPLGKDDIIRVRVPGSKSMTNRALLLAALAEGESVIDNLLLSDDSKYFLASVESLGYQIDMDESTNKVTIQGSLRIPEKNADIYVGSAGTAARFLSTMAAFGAIKQGGRYRIDASEQMKRRPMHQLLDACASLGANVTYEEEEGKLPVIISCQLQDDDKNQASAYITINIDESSQFLSALLLNAPILNKDITIELTGKRTAKAYVTITMQMMRAFGVLSEQLNEQTFHVNRGQQYQSRRYTVEPDLSAACYFYALAAVTGREAVVEGVHTDSCQGDLHFLSILEEMGCDRWEEDDGIHIRGPRDGQLQGITVDMSDCSDQTMTLAAIAPFAQTSVRINNVGHIRKQESDRIHAICTELTRMRVTCEEGEDYLVIEPGKPEPVVVETYNDHRMAMAFAITGVMVPGMRISNPQCAAKTFPEFFDVLNTL